ncbi:hypothetical protein K1T35_44510 [Pseudonocardia sp. DSM 110487]|uniref:hypothetical protein n=1 Tax=Pseudonocardia sp. DSM 110487 TaxID=2865833 RepID=UPI001C6A60F7|nr:hypothetical protein [Pseudonocardia sp. DSM 110487]QYN35310.1 hypothetical protein K1T35_44510 [Pseudonocardia sp. DSM 110487]
MARFNVASRASFRSERVRVSARISISMTVRSLGGGWGGRDDRLVAELSEYSSHADLLDLGATLDRHADEDTAEIREILADAAR